MAKNLTELIDEKFGVTTTSKINPLVASIGTTVTQFLRNNPRRVAWIICNLSSADVYIAPDEEVSLARGIWVTPNGGSYTMIWDEDFHFTGWAWYASSSAAARVMVLEVEIYG